MPEFHAQFQSAGLEFRILKLLSRDSSINIQGSGTPAVEQTSAADVPIHCQLYHKFHKDKPSYKALSYTWGDPAATVPIFIDQRKYSVTTNLYSALQHIRRDKEDVHIWIDAICINQDDDSEKSEQVKKMKDIYVDATETIVWLGLSDASTQDTIFELNRVGKFIFENGILDQMISFAMLPSDDQQAYQSAEKEIKSAVSSFLDEAAKDLPGIEKLLNGMASLLARPYWERVWILQEIVVSPNVLIQVGPYTLPFSNFHGAHMYLSIMTAWVMVDVHTRLMNLLQTSPDSQEFAEKYELFMRIANITTPKAPGRIAGMRRNHQRFLQKDPTAKVPPGLVQLLARVFIDNSPKATEDKDRIYSLLGMASDLRALNITPDYSPSVSVMDVYNQVARALLERGEIDVLSFAQYAEDEEREGPSWVPDWRKTIVRPSGQLPWDTSFRASGPQPSSALSNNPDLPTNYIQLSGFIIDKVQTLAPTPWTPSDGVTKKHKEVSTYLSEITTLCKLSDDKLLATPGEDPYPNPQDRKSAHFCVPVAEQEEYGIGFIRRSTSDTLIFYKAVVEDLGRNGFKVKVPEGNGEEKDGGNGEEVGSGRYYNVLSWQRNRRAFLSEKGFVGLGPKDVKEGDLVVCFKGARFVYVLRQVESEGRERYVLVGEAYVHGVMYGELFEGKGTRGLVERELVLT